MKFFLLLCLVGTSLAIDKAQLHGLKNLLTNLHSGVFTTCQLVLFSEMVDYDTAEKNCQNFNIGMGDVQGHLATVNDSEKNSDLKLLLNMAYPYKGWKNQWAADQWVWAGLRKTKNNDGSDTSMKYKPEDWSWAADETSPKEFHKWMRKQPDQKPEIRRNGVTLLQNQMRINHKGHWDDTFKYKKHPYACDYQGKYIISANSKTWSQSKAECEAAGLELAKVRSDAEVEEIIKSADYFLGSKADSVKVWDKENWIWLGGTDEEEEGVWKWVDGSPIDKKIMNWRNPNPDNAEFIKDHAEHYLAISRDGQFDDSFDHRSRHRAFACQCPGT
ncbi:C-type mannose receptor 2-like [Bolinopsis microptera]|uniref:C-type mannose receptor 2-like n=1 Tax=Bolinopsis microptera TaxID=2820187 RepID=UPI003078F08C